MLVTFGTETILPTGWHFTSWTNFKTPFQLPKGAGRARGVKALAFQSLDRTRCRFNPTWGQGIFKIPLPPPYFFFEFV